MKVERINIPACCGATSLIFKTDQPLSKNHLDFFVQSGFTEAFHFTEAGILYATNSELIMTGPFGSNRLTVKCKKEANCNQKLNDLEDLLTQIG